MMNNADSSANNNDSFFDTIDTVDIIGNKSTKRGYFSIGTPSQDSSRIKDEHSYSNSKKSYSKHSIPENNYFKRFKKKDYDSYSSFMISSSERLKYSPPKQLASEIARKTTTDANNFSGFQRPDDITHFEHKEYNLNNEGSASEGAQMTQESMDKRNSDVYANAFIGENYSRNNSSLLNTQNDSFFDTVNQESESFQGDRHKRPSDDKKRNAMTLSTSSYAYDKNLMITETRHSLDRHRRVSGFSIDHLGFHGNMNTKIKIGSNTIDLFFDKYSDSIRKSLSIAPAGKFDTSNIEQIFIQSKDTLAEIVAKTEKTEDVISKSAKDVVSIYEKSGNIKGTVKDIKDRIELFTEEISGVHDSKDSIFFSLASISFNLFAFILAVILTIANLILALLGKRERESISIAERRRRIIAARERAYSLNSKDEYSTEY